MDLTLILSFFSALLAGAMALALLWFERRSIAHWAFAFGMVVLAAESIFTGLCADALLPADMVYWQHWRLTAMSFLPGAWLLFSLSYARGNYREFLHKWRFGLVSTFVLPVGLAIGFHRALFVSIQRAGPEAPWMLGLSLPGLALNLLWLLSAIIVLMNLEKTYRAAVGTMRWRIKFVVLGLGVLFAVRAWSTSQALLFRSLNLSLQALNGAALLVACLLISRSLFRVGHFDVNVFPSQSLLHNSLTVMLAGIYLVIVGVLAKIVTFLGGDASFTLKAFVVLVLLVLLTILLLSDRVRLRTRRFVSRHFQRPLYDYRAVWRTFTEGTVRRVELNDLCAEVARLASETFQALSVTIWLLDDRKEQLRFVTSTSLSQTKADRLSLDRADAAQVVSALTGLGSPVDLDSSKDVWAAILRRLHPDEFHKGGNRVCVPLNASAELLGLMMLGDRVGGVPFSAQDFDLLKSVGDQTAASVLNIRLSDRLAQAKQLEAFQAMSAFFVHDLKNTASTLSLMLQNLPVHFNDPAFREDALRGVSRTVTHINEIISRLSLLRQELTIKPVEADLNETIREALAGLDQGTIPQISGSAAASTRPGSGGNLLTDLGPLPKVRLDPAQIRNVVTNLVLNARDASTSNGQVRIQTSQHNGWAVFSVSDDGCGMTPEFIQNSLYRPFQTTKKQGIGIGMFQCKMIVERHQGRIEVDSEPGKGTAFRVLLPIQTARESATG